MNAGEFLRQREERLRTDPGYRAQVEAAEAERQEQLRRQRDDERPIVDDLNDAGVPVSGLWELNRECAPSPSPIRTRCRS